MIVFPVIKYDSISYPANQYHFHSTYTKLNLPLRTTGALLRKQSEQLVGLHDPWVCNIITMRVRPSILANRHLLDTLNFRKWGLFR